MYSQSVEGSCVAQRTTHDLEVTDSNLTGSTGFFVGQTTVPYLVLMKVGKDTNNVSYRRDRTEENVESNHSRHHSINHSNPGG